MSFNNDNRDLSATCISVRNEGFIVAMSKVVKSMRADIAREKFIRRVTKQRVARRRPDWPKRTTRFIGPLNREWIDKDRRFFKPGSRKIVCFKTSPLTARLSGPFRRVFDGKNENSSSDSGDKIRYKKTTAKINNVMARVPITARLSGRFRRRFKK